MTNIKLQGGVDNPGAGIIQAGVEITLIYRTSPSAHLEFVGPTHGISDLAIATAIYLNAAGDVGVGDIPESKFNVFGDIQIGSGSNTNADLNLLMHSGKRLVVNGITTILMRAANAGGANWGQTKIITTAPASGDGKMVLQTSKSNVSFDRLTIDENGKVDIPGILENSQTAKAFINFNGTGTVAIRDSHNVSSITDNGTGDYTINFTSAFPDVNYSPVISAGEGVDDVVAVIHTISTGSVRTQLNNFGGTLVDALYVTLNAFGN